MHEQPVCDLQGDTRITPGPSSGSALQTVDGLHQHGLEAEESELGAATREARTEKLTKRSKARTISNIHCWVLCFLLLFCTHPCLGAVLMLTHEMGSSRGNMTVQRCLCLQACTSTCQLTSRMSDLHSIKQSTLSH